MSKPKTYNHPTYEKARAFWLEVEQGQIAKGEEKYPEPLNPDSWTGQELIQHAMQENVDQAHYLWCLKDRIEKLERENKELKKRLEERE